MNVRWKVLALMLLATAAPGCAPTHDATTTAPPPGPSSELPTGAAPELNERFVDPEMNVDEWVERFETESREVYVNRHDLVAAAGVDSGDRVADVGAGTGLFTRLFADAVGDDGHVFAVEISPRFIEHINAWAAETGAANVTAVFGRTDSVSLPEASIDVAFVCDTYHHFEDPVAMLASIRHALAPGGTLLIVDFERIPGVSRDWLLEHVRAGKETVRTEIEDGGFEFVDEVDVEAFEENYVLRFRRR